MEQKVLAGTIRIGKNLQIYEKTKFGWKKSAKEFPEAISVAKLFKEHGNFKALIDTKNSNFLKGQLSPDGKVQGARINVLPNGKKLDKAYSLLASDLTIHDQSSNSHWDVIYKNPNGKYAYVYTLEKIGISKKEKYNEVRNFERIYSKLYNAVLSSLKKDDDEFALPMYTLLKTYMRVGSELYYKKNKHKGLTTLKKSDVTLHGNSVMFKFKAKDGVPLEISRDFPEIYIKRLRSALRKINNSSFIFTSSSGHPLTDMQFKEAFKRYCGREFYPHIVRSYYATKTTEDFLKKHRKATKDEVTQLFLSIAENLGHRRFAKKEGIWKDNYTVTIHHYIKPDLVEKVQSLIKN